jgi:hypothetical protein
MLGKKLRYFAPVLVLLQIADRVFAADEAQPKRMAAELVAEIDGPLLADFPLLFKLKVKNTGTAPISYWCGGPGRYPTASPFVVTATDEAGKQTILRLDNGQHRQGSGDTHWIKGTQTLPAACNPLPAGKYTLQIAAKADHTVDQRFPRTEVRPPMQSAPISVEIVEDRAALNLAHQQLLNREKNDAFSEYVTQAYSIDPIVQTWLNQLLDDDPNVGLEASGRLHYRVIRYPSGGDAILKQAAKKFCRQGTGKAEKNLLRQISLICRGVQTDDAIDAMVIIANSAADVEYTRQMAVSDLGDVPGVRAEKALIDLAADQDSPVYWKALSCLAHRHNPVALKPLIRAATDPNSTQRPFALVALTEFRDMPEVRRALDTAAQDENAKVREAAKKALEWQKFNPDKSIHWPW